MKTLSGLAGAAPFKEISVEKKTVASSENRLAAWRVFMDVCFMG
jgi:hypothetical protein